jgi:hypothetical protein
MKVLDACHEKTAQMEADFGPQDVELMPLEVSVLIVERRDTEREEGHIRASSQLDMSPSATRSLRYSERPRMKVNRPVRYIRSLRQLYQLFPSILHGRANLFPTLQTHSFAPTSVHKSPDRMLLLLVLVSSVC